MSQLINGLFYVVSKKSNKIYTINKDLRCDCKAGTYKKTCSHVREVMGDLDKGKFSQTKNSVLTKELGFQNNRVMMGSEEARYY